MLTGTVSNVGINSKCKIRVNRFLVKHMNFVYCMTVFSLICSVAILIIIEISFACERPFSSFFLKHSVTL